MFLQCNISWSSYQLSVSVLNQISTIPETQTYFFESGQHDTQDVEQSKIYFYYTAKHLKQRKLD